MPNCYALKAPLWEEVPHFHWEFQKLISFDRTSFRNNKLNGGLQILEWQPREEIWITNHKHNRTTTFLNKHASHRKLHSKWSVSLYNTAYRRHPATRDTIDMMLDSDMSLTELGSDLLAEKQLFPCLSQEWTWRHGHLNILQDESSTQSKLSQHK